MRSHNNNNNNNLCWTIFSFFFVSFFFLFRSVRVCYVVPSSLYTLNWWQINFYFLCMLIVEAWATITWRRTIQLLLRTIVLIIKVNLCAAIVVLLFLIFAFVRNVFDRTLSFDYVGSSICLFKNYSSVCAQNNDIIVSAIHKMSTKRHLLFIRRRDNSVLLLILTKYFIAKIRLKANKMLDRMLFAVANVINQWGRGRGRGQSRRIEHQSIVSSRF